MPTQSVTPSCAGHLQDIADVLFKAKKVVVITGAGISTNLGIPDFRSENGLYALIQAQYDAAAAEREKAEREELKRSAEKAEKEELRKSSERIEKEEVKKTSITPNTKSRSSSPNKASASHPVTTRGSTRPFETFTIKTRSTTTTEAQDARIFTRSRSDLTPTWSRRQTLDNPDSLLKRSSSSLSRTPQIIQKRPSVPRSGEIPTNITSTSNTAFTTRPSLKRSQSLETGLNVPKSGTPFIPRASKRIKLLHESSSTPPPSADTSSKEPSPTSDTSLPSSQTSIVSTTRAILPKLKGKDLFDSMVWGDKLTTSIFLTFIATLRKQVREEVVGTSHTHKFIKVLRDGGRLVRNYTQNIDGLEAREGLDTQLSSGTGRRSRFFSGVVSKPRMDDRGGDHHGGVEVVQLHGGLHSLRCSLCGEQSPWQRDSTQGWSSTSTAAESTTTPSPSDPTTTTSSSSSSPSKSTAAATAVPSSSSSNSEDGDEQSDREEVLRGGRAPGCDRCIRADEARQHRGRRSVAVGKLRPDVVLYGEEHPEATRIGELVTHDISLGPDVILIMGTSLRVHGLKVMVREFARAAHAKGGKVVFVNNTKPPESTWGDSLDYWAEMDCDRWVQDLKERRGELWLPQGLPVEPKESSSNRRAHGIGKLDSSAMPARKSLAGMPKSTPTPKTTHPATATSEPKPSAKRWQCEREDEMNGAYWAFQFQLNLEIIGSRPRSYAPNCNPYRRYGKEKWRRDGWRANNTPISTASASTSSPPTSALTLISMNVPRPIKCGRGKESDDSSSNSERDAGSQLQRELSASVGPVSRASRSLLLPTPPPSDETEAPEKEPVIVTPRTRQRIKVASSIERILSSPMRKRRY